MTKVSIALPCLDSNNWFDIYQSIEKSLEGKYEFELIPVGPFLELNNFGHGWVDDPKNIRFIRDFGNPNRALSIAAEIAEGEIFTWMSQDCLITSGFKTALDLFLSDSNSHDGVCMPYLEGEGHESDQTILNRMGPTSGYWMAKNHAATAVYGVPDYFINAPVGMYRLETFKYFGMVDCVNFGHINMSTIILGHDIQRLGGKIHIPPEHTMRANFVPNNSFIWSCFDQDGPNFIKLSREHNDYKILGTPEKYQWRNAESVWSKRWGRSS